MDDPFDLRRFVDAQDPVIEQVRRELRAGRKQSHWMWFVFPQAAGLGHSAMSRRYAISGPEEAAAYLAHPLLGARLRELTVIVNGIKERSLEEIFGDVDAMKFSSCMDLFAQAAPDEPVFREVASRGASLA